MDDDIQKYIWNMTEIKFRIDVINDFIKGKRTTGQLPTDVEFLCLQFRMILELIALSSLCANKNEYARMRREFHRDWHATRILEALEKVNPNFYPEPTRQIIDENTGQVVRVEKITEEYLTKENFIDIYDKCCNILHAHNPYNEYPDIVKIKELMSHWVDKIVKLLNHHQIQLVESGKQLWILMQSKDEGKVHVFEMRRI